MQYMNALNCNRQQAWRNIKNKYTRKLEEDLKLGKVDQDIIPILLALNKKHCVATTSSCSGRIVAIISRTPHDKKHAYFLLKKHEKITIDELIMAINKAKNSSNTFAWISVQPLLLHMYVCGEENTKLILSYAESIGFKHACAKPTKHKNIYYVYITGTERLDIPLQILESTKKESLEEILYLLNTYLSFTKRKLDKIKTTIHILAEKLCNK